MSTVKIQLASASTPLTFYNVENTWTQGGLFCIRVRDENGEMADHKYPLANVFEVVEPH